MFTEAATRVAADGRSTITTADITAAFVAVGGGVSARLLELCGVPLARLLPDESTLDPRSLDPSSLDPITPGQDTLEDDSPALPRDPAPLNGDERLPMDDLSRSAVGIVRLANLLADGRGEVISTYTLLLAFGAMGSEVLRRGMHEQGTTGERAFRQLSGMLTPGAVICPPVSTTYWTRPADAAPPGVRPPVASARPPSSSPSWRTRSRRRVS